ncbi:TetR-like C-terminal domain-containing protein [Bacillus sp. S/N-304-OC-R1]|uniref:TetR-like C-terminal domain-containing protein n=1 Tax=Bacillus sp. S/N-304-OC-R1 TaxID=2758034 RepID=UPI001C8DDC79|nr:TetR/AcrR family transcriptional regulator [Bacillus sp. S/N-304-OC-R1]MBY0122763.1 WHG domain-containing protein [Bacillus sp. S/N-304-OC-R1]
MSRRIKIDLSIILEKATQLIDDHGLDQLSLGMLAEELEIRPPSLYNHVNGLNELKQKLAIYGTKKLYGSLLQAAVGRSGDEAIRSVGWAYLQFVRQHPGLYQATCSFVDREDNELQEAQQSIVGLALQVLQAYQLEKEKAIHMVRGLRSILHGFASIEQTGGFGMPIETDKSFLILINTFINGLHTHDNSGIEE